MPFADFRQFLDVLRQHGELIDINRPVALERRRQGDEAGLCPQRPGHHVQQQRHRLSAGRRHLFDARQGAARLRGRRGHDLRQGAARPRQPDPADVRRQRRAVPRRDHRRRRHRHPQFPGAAIQPQGRRAVYHAGHRRLRGSGDRRAGCRPLPLSHSRQGHVLVLGAAVPSLRQESGEVQKARHRAEGGADHRRRSDHRLYLPGAGARHHRRLGAGRRLARRAGRADALQDLRRQGAGDLGSRDRVRGRSQHHRARRPARRIYRLLHAAVAEAGGAHHRDHASAKADLPGPAHRQAGDREPHPQADSVRGLVPARAQAPVPDHQAGLGARLGRRVVLRGDLDGAALCRRGAAGDPHRDVEQYPAEMDRDRRSRHRRAFLDRSRMGAGLPRPAGARRHRHRQRAGRAVRSVGRSDPRPHHAAFRRRSASTPRGRSAKSFTTSPTCRAGRITRCRSSTGRRS